MPKGFLPTEDIDQLSVTTEAVQGHFFRGASRRVSSRWPAIVRKPPRRRSVHVQRGRARQPRWHQPGRAVHSPASLAASASTAPSRSPPSSSRQLAAVPSMRAFLQVPPPIRLGGRRTKSEYQLTLQGTDTDVAVSSRRRCSRDELSKSPCCSDVTTDVQLKNPQVSVDIDAHRAAELGVSVATHRRRAVQRLRLATSLQHLTPATTRYQVILELDPEPQRDPNALRGLYVRSDNGRLVPLESVASLSRSVGPLVGESFRAAAGRHRLVQRDARPRPERSRRRRRRTRRAARCPRASPLAFKARPKRFSRRCPGSGCCCWFRCLRDLPGARHSVRELASTRSRSCPRCRSPASARWSRC